MKRHSAIHITQVCNLEAGDLIAWEFLGQVIGAKVTGVAYTSFQLTEEQRGYMSANGLDIPEEHGLPLGGDNQILVFMERPVPGLSHKHKDHAYLDLEQSIVVFENSTIKNTPSI